MLITDALCYSTTDIFSAGFQDHGIGPVIGSGNTGAGGANVWTYADVLQALPTHFEALPKQASMRVAIRRTTRVGARAGDPLEDLGVVSDIEYKMTRGDLLQQNVDLIAKAGEVLGAMPRRALAVQLTATAGGVDVAMTTAGLDRLDMYVDERPVATIDVADGEHAQSVALMADGSHVIEVRGFSAGELGGKPQGERRLTTFAPTCQCGDSVVRESGHLAAGTRGAGPRHVQHQNECEDCEPRQCTTEPYAGDLDLFDLEAAEMHVVVSVVQQHLRTMPEGAIAAHA